MKAPGVEQEVDMSEVREQDFLPGLDNGYVVDVERDADLRDGRYNVRVGAGHICLTFHTANGDEAYLLAPPDMPVTISREES